MKSTFTAMQLADWLQSGAEDPMWVDHTEMPKFIAACAAAELRRLHEAHDWQYKMAGDRLRRIEKLEAVNKELLEALKAIMNIDSFSALTEADVDAIDAQARAAIEKAEEQE